MTNATARRVLVALFVGVGAGLLEVGARNCVGVAILVAVLVAAIRPEWYE